MTSVGLPSIALWRGMQSRASALPLLMHEAFREDSGRAAQQVRLSLRQLATLACFAQAARLSLYCRECSSLLSLYRQQDSRREILGPLLLCACVRMAQSLERPLLCTIDNANLIELRQARGARRVEQVPSAHSAAWAIPRLKTLLLKQLLSAHYTLGDASNSAARCTILTQPNSFQSLNRVAALWQGGVLLQSVNDCENCQQTCVQILRLELCCQRVGEGKPSVSFTSMRSLFLESSMHKALHGLRKQMRMLIQHAEREGMSIERCLLAFHKTNACCTILPSCYGQSLGKVSVSAQRLALHLRCWAERECEASALLCLCVLVLERQLDMSIAALQGRRVCERTDMRLQRRVQHFIRTHRRRLCSAYAVPVTSVRGIAHKELQGIHQGFRLSFKHCTQVQAVTPVDDDFFHALIRFKAIALYMGEVALYEMIWNLRELVVLAIESKLTLSKTLIAMLPRLSAYGLRCFKLGRRALGYDTQLVNRLSEELRIQRQIMLLRTDWHERRVSLPARVGQRSKRDKRSIATAQLPSFLANNIRGLTADPVTIYRCQSAQEFAGLTRVLILELTLLARGARALQVERVASLSEVLLEVYRALNALSLLPEPEVLRRNLQGAHRCLRVALNQAAARQRVCDVRPTIVSLYHFLECLLRAPAHAADSIHAALITTNSLAADLRAFADVFASVVSAGHGGRYHLAQEQLRVLMATTRRLQEDLAASEMIGVGRWGPSLMVAVGRFSNEQGKSARLELNHDETQATRGVVEQLQVPLQSLLCLVIEHSVEAIPQRRANRKPDSALLRLRAARNGSVLEVCIEDDGAGLAANQLESVAEEVEALGGSLSLVSASANGNLIRVAVPSASVRWDIASKPL